jgi:voltage-gated potassium channel
MKENSKQRGRFAGLLVAQLFFIFVTPLITDGELGALFLQLGVWSIIVAGIFAASARRGYLVISSVLALGAIIAWLGPDFLPGNLDEVARMLTAALCFTMTAVIVVQAVMKHERVTADTVLGGINSYLLIAFAFMFVYATIVTLEPRAYLVQGQSMMEVLTTTSDAYSFALLLYFSFTTLTTLGYGDIVPVGSIARLTTSAEAVIGQLYVAIFIGRIVGLQVSARRLEKAESAVE